MQVTTCQESLRRPLLFDLQFRAMQTRRLNGRDGIVLDGGIDGAIRHEGTHIEPLGDIQGCRSPLQIVGRGTRGMHTDGGSHPT